MAFDTWYASQHIFDSTPPTGCRMFQRINQWTVDFFCRDAGGFETPQSGAPVTCSVYAIHDRLLYTSQSTTTALGWTTCEPRGTALEGYDGRVKVVASGTSPTGSATSAYYRQSGAEAGVFGVVMDAEKGTVTFSSPARLFSSFSVPVTNGAFAAPTLAGLRGALRARFRGAGLHADRTVTKAGSPYALVLTGTP